MRYQNISLDGEAYITPEELFLEMSFKKVHDKEESSLLKRIFAQYIRIRNIFYQSTIQGERTGKGLGVFKGINGNQKLNSNTDDYLFKVLVEQSNNQNLLKLEVRTTPNADKSKAIKGLKTFFVEYLKFLTGDRVNEKSLDEVEIDAKKKGIPLQLGITYHFIKKKENKIDCAIASGEEYLKAEEEAKVLKELLQKVEGLDNYIVGIDAASNEIGTTPTSLFKAYKTLRSDDLHTENSIGYTYHVGEEFSDILSGLRAVDEVVEGLNYRPGDRIGHGIVLGIDVDKWYADNQIIYLEAREYLENLIWLRNLYIQEVQTPTISISYLESKIYSLIKRILGFNKGIDLNTLTEIYLDKVRGKKFEVDVCEECPLKGLTEDKHNLTFNKLPQNSWDKKTLLLAYRCLFFYKGYYNVIEVDVDKEVLEEYKKAQKYMIKKLSRKGVVLELNPSSNLKIGNFKNLNDYFIENISNPKEEKLLVTINTDDPVVFSTTLKNEYSLIYEMFIEKGYGRSETLEWLDKIRKNGLEYNFVKDRGLTREEIVNEVKEILKRLDEV
jgi:adenosine deaminase